jgi:tetratricopeptide (TPR) repeat protein
MPFVRKTETKDSPQPHNQKLFIGRAKEQKFFKEKILDREEPTHNIISVSGQGGVGKSTLLAQFMDVALSPAYRDYCLIGLVDERQVTPSGIMEKFANDLHITGEFEKALIRYKEALNKLQPKRETKQEALLRKAPKLASAVVEDIPLAGGLLREGTKMATELLADRHRERHLLKDAERLENPINDLTKAFVEELNRLAGTQITLSFNRVKRQHRLILFFDTFELLGKEAAPWLLDHFLLAEISNQVVLVIAGRDPIERSISDDPKRWLTYYDNNVIKPIILDSFTEEEARSYLDTRGITEPERITLIWQLSHGLPLYLSLLTSNPQGAVDPTKDAVANFLRWIPETEHVKRKLALDASLLSRPFNQDDLEAFSYLSDHERTALYQWLTEQPFVQTSPQDGRHSYHELAQALFNLHMFQKSRNEYYSMRGTLVDFYRGLLEKTQIEELEVPYHTAVQSREVFYPADWVELAMAVAFQLFFMQKETDHSAAIEQVLNAYEYSEHSEEIIRILRKLSQDHSNNLISPAIQESIKRLLRYIEADQQENKRELLAAAESLLEIVEHKPSLSKKSKLIAHVYRKRGFAYRRLNQFDKAIEDYSRAIELDPNYSRAYASRGSVYRVLKDYERAIEDFDQALKHNPKYASAYNSRSETYRLGKEYLRALEDLNRAIELEPYYARAYARRGLIHLCLQKNQQARDDYLRSWQLNPAHVPSAWMAEWTKWCLKGNDREMADRLEVIAAINPHHYLAYVCQGVALWQRQRYAEALDKLEKKAIQLETENWDAYFWKGMVCASLSQDEDAIASIEISLDLEMPPILLAPLRWLEQDRPDFYAQYVIPLLSRS